MMSPEIYEKICQHLENTGDGILKTCSKVFHVSHFEFYKLCDSDDLYKARYARAKIIQCDKIIEDAVDIADNNVQDAKTVTGPNGELVTVEDREWVNRSRLRVDTRKWLASKLLPKKYGDAVQHKMTDGDGNPLSVVFNVPRPGDKSYDSHG